VVIDRLLFSRIFTEDGGAEGIRTPDPHNAIVVLYQLSYDPIRSDGNLECRSELSKPFFCLAAGAAFTFRAVAFRAFGFPARLLRWRKYL
jgi:hypothetical protein